MWQHHILAPQDISRHTPGWRAIARSQRPRTMNKGLKILFEHFEQCSFSAHVFCDPWQVKTSRYGCPWRRHQIIWKLQMWGIDIKTFNFTLLQDSLILSNLGNFAWKGKVSTRGLEGCRWQGCASSQLLRCSLAASDQCNELVLPFVSWIRWNRLQK